MRGWTITSVKRLITSQRGYARDTRQNSPTSTSTNYARVMNFGAIDKVVERLAECIARTKIYVGLSTGPYNKTITFRFAYLMFLKHYRVTMKL